MPNTGHKWTPEEERDAVTLDRDEFLAKYPDVSPESYRQRRGRLVTNAAPALGSSEGDLEAAIKNNIKLARTVIRLRHSIEADDELRAAIPGIRLALSSQAQDGKVTGLSYEELRSLVYGAE